MAEMAEAESERMEALRARARRASASKKAARDARNAQRARAILAASAARLARAEVFGPKAPPRRPKSATQLDRELLERLTGSLAADGSRPIRPRERLDPSLAPPTRGRQPARGKPAPPPPKIVALKTKRAAKGQVVALKPKMAAEAPAKSPMLDEALSALLSLGLSVRR